MASDAPVQQGSCLESPIALFFQQDIGENLVIADIGTPIAKTNLGKCYEVLPSHDFKRGEARVDTVDPHSNEGLVSETSTLSAWDRTLEAGSMARTGIPLPVRTHCPYCALQCGTTLLVERQSALPGHPDRGRPGTEQSSVEREDVIAVQIEGDALFPVNRGAMCIKGRTAGETLRHPDRLLAPMARDSNGKLSVVDWDEAIGLIADAFSDIRARYGPDAIGVFGGGSLTNEKAYLLGKFARVAIGTSNVDYNGRFCMSSAASASIRAFGLDRGLPFPVEDIIRADAILVAGGNPADTMPPIMRYFEAQREAGGALIVADPRSSQTAKAARLHLRLTPGSDAALASGILHVLVRDNLIDADYIEKRTTGFEELRAMLATYWPERVERITGVAQNQIVRAAHLLGKARRSMVLTARGAEQHSHGVANTLAYINIALALGQVGKTGGGFGCITGQGNGQGGREHGQKADQLPGYRSITDSAARKHVASVWAVEESEIPGPGKSAYEMLDSLGPSGGIRGMLVIGSNPAVSAPHLMNVRERLASLSFLAVADYFVSETAEMADVVLPSAQWAEEDGTMTNLEGRVIRRRRALDPPGQARTDAEILCELARPLGKGWHFQYRSTEEIFEELRRASAGGAADYSGISYDKIEAQDGVFWPCPSDSHSGTPRLFGDGFPTPDGRARFHAIPHAAPAERPSPEYPLYLTTGRSAFQYQSGTQTRKVGELNALAPGPAAEIHPRTARRHGIADGDSIVIESRRGSCLVMVKTSAEIREDTVFVAFHWGGERAVNQLTNPALDPFSRMPEFKACAIRIAGKHGSGEGKQQAGTYAHPPSR